MNRKRVFFRLSFLGRQVLTDHRVVRRGPFKTLSQFKAEFSRNGSAVFSFLPSPGIISRISHNGHRLVVFGRRSEHGRAPDIDKFNRFMKLEVSFCRCRFERIKIHDHEVNRLNPVLPGLLTVAFFRAKIKKPSVNLGMKGLDAAIKHFGKSGKFVNRPGRHTGFPKRFKSPARGRISTRCLRRVLANGISPFLSETLISARRMTCLDIIPESSFLKSGEAAM